MRAVGEFCDLFGNLRVRRGQRLSGHLQCEQTDFVRFNRGQVRQTGHVDQATVALELFDGQRHASLECNLGSDRAENLAILQGAVDALAQLVPELPEDPHALLPEQLVTVEDVPALPAFDLGGTVDDIAGAAQGLDLVGILAQGPVGAAYCDTAGQRMTWQRNLSLFDYSVYAHGDKAIKRQLAGDQWNGAALRGQLDDVRARLPVLHRPEKVLTPGQYRAWLAPSAVAALIDVLSWTGFSAKAHKTRQSHLQRLSDGKGRLHPRIAIAEDIANGIGPCFAGSGFVKPPRVPLIADGRFAGSLCSPRTAREYALPTDGAADSEDPMSASMAAGTLRDADILRQIGTGLWVDNLWYLNFSDRDACRITGMTRFATLWVEDGEPVAPVGVMRFDDTLERMLGSELADLGAEAQLCVDALTWKRRANRCARVPGALLNQWALTL